MTISEITQCQKCVCFTIKFQQNAQDRKLNEIIKLRSTEDPVVLFHLFVLNLNFAANVIWIACEIYEF